MGKVFLFKTGCIIYLTVVALNCFAGQAERKLSVKEKRQELRDSLHSLLELLDEPEQKSEKEAGETLKVQRQRVENLHHAVQNQGNDEEELMEEEVEFTEEKEDEEINTRALNWKEVLAEEHNSYVKTLFRKDKELMERLKENPEPLFFSIQFGNLDLVRFFSEEGQLINKARKSSNFSPLASSFIARWEDVILYFFSHPKTNLRQTNVWEDNIFHTVFLVEHPRQRLKGKRKMVNRLDLLNILFQPKYFLKIFDLLLTENSDGDTPLDLALKADDMPDQKKAITLLERKMKLATQLKELSQDQLKSLARILFGDDVTFLRIEGMSQDETNQLIKELNAYEVMPVKNKKNQKKKGEGKKQESEESMAEREREPSNQGGEQTQPEDQKPPSLLCKEGFSPQLYPGEVLPE